MKFSLRLYSDKQNRKQLNNVRIILPFYLISESNIEMFGTGNQFVCEAGTVGKISDCQQEGPGFNPGRGLNFGRPSFATPSMDRDVKLLV